MEFLKFISAEMETPVSFGWYHFMCLGIVIAITVLFCIKLRDCSDKTFRFITLIGWIIIVLLEIMKQFIFTYSVENNKIVADFQWYAFPYQLCSSPLYILPFVAFMKDCKLREFFTSFISTFSLFGGLVVLIYPNDVFIETTAINIQTMIHHGLQVVFGIWYAVHFRARGGIKYFLKSIPVFIVMLAIAVLLNETLGAHIVSTGENFSMFYVSSHVENHLPILSMVYTAVPWFVFLLIYIIGFCIASCAVYFIMYGIWKLVLLIRRKVNEKTAE